MCAQHMFWSLYSDSARKSGSLPFTDIHGSPEIELPHVTCLLSERAEVESMSDKHQIPCSFYYIASQMEMCKIEIYPASSAHHWLSLAFLSLIHIIYKPLYLIHAVYRNQSLMGPFLFIYNVSQVKHNI